MHYIKTIKTFKSLYNRLGEIALVEDECILCGVNKKCLYINDSEGEYSGASICGDCAKKECEADG